MSRISTAALIALVLALIAVAIGLSVRTAATTFNYPAYSSFNNEELGLRAYYETARRLGIPVERNYGTLAKLVGAKGTAIFASELTASDYRYQETKDLERYERVAKPGIRLLFLMNEREENYVKDETKIGTAGDARKAAEPKHDGEKQPEAKKDGIPKPAGKRQDGKNPKPKEPVDNLRLHWGVELKSVETPHAETPWEKAVKGTDYVNQGVRFVTSRVSFSKWSESWKPTAGADGQVYMLERNFDAGSVVLLLGLESFTNKTLLTKVDGARLASTLSGPAPLIFDEAHLGVADDETVTGYARQRHLQWLLLGLVVLAGLYVWRSSVSFVPALPEIRGTQIAGREAHAALISLLSQSIKRPDLPREIIAAWRESFRMLPSSKVHVTEESLEAFAVAGDSAAAAGYAAISQSARRMPPP